MASHSRVVENKMHGRGAIPADLRGYVYLFLNEGYTVPALS